VGAVLLYFYYKYDLKTIIIEEGADLNIFIVENDELIKTGYILLFNNIEKRGESYELSGTLEKVPFNTTVIVCNTNLEEQNYYTYCEEIFIRERSNRLRLEIKQPHQMNITQEGIFGIDSKIILDLKSEYFKDLRTCMKYSIHFIRVDLEGIERIDKPQEFKNYDKCYDLNLTLENNEIRNINLTYSTLGLLNDRQDYVILIFFDLDTLYNNVTMIRNQFEHRLNITAY
jgi:hypothetical protein